MLSRDRKCLLLVLLLPALGVATAESVNYDYYKYHPMKEISDWMARMETAHPDVVTLVEYGKTYEKKTISLLKIGEKTGEKKKAMWMDCGIHAREWIAPAFCQYFVSRILEAHQTQPQMREMMRNVDFYVTPVLNIDGYAYTWEDSANRLWRKNRSPGPAACDCDGDDCYGTDLNRNFDANWGTIGVSTNCSSNIYCGSEALSEPEAQAVTYFVGSRIEDFLCFLTIHSYGQLLLLPYGHPNFTADNEDELLKVGLGAADAIRNVHGMNYTVGTSPDVLYPNSGSSRDWARLKGIPFSYTFELRDNGTFGFELPEDQIRPTCEEAYEGALHIITYVHDKTFKVAAATTAPTISTTDTAATAAATVWTILLALCMTGTTLI